MPRELKFRVWDNLKKSWVSNKDVFRIRTDTDGVGGIVPPHAFWWKEHPQGLTFQQFTGLYDKNNRGIFEGDILLCTFRTDHRYVEVHFHAGSFLFESRMPMEFMQYNEVEVAGNILENPELVKQLRKRMYE